MGKHFVWGRFFLSFSVYSAHSHYEIFHNVEALRGKRMENFRKQLTRIDKPTKKTLHCYKMHKRVTWSPSSTEKGTRRVEGSWSVGSPVRISKCLVSLFYQKFIKGLRNRGNIVEVTLLDMTGVVTVMKPKRVRPSVISRELTCTMYMQQFEPNRLRVVSLALNPSWVTRKKTAIKNSRVKSWCQDAHEMKIIYNES